METQARISFRHMTTSPAIEQTIRSRLTQIEERHPSITACHVVIEKAHAHHRQGNLFQVRITLDVPGREIAASNNPGADHAHEDIHVALHDAFDALRRQLDDHVRVRRGRS